MAETIPIREKKTLSDEHYLLQKVTYETPPDKDGATDNLSREVYWPADSATILLYNLDKKTVILLQQFRLAAYLNGHPDGMLLETCAGNINEQETPDESIIREVQEETGYQVKAVQKLFALYSTPGAVTEKLHYYVGAYTDADKTGKGGGLAAEHEAIEVNEMPFDDAYSKIAAGEIVDAKTLLLLLYAKDNIF